MKLGKQKFDLVLSIIVFFVIGSKLVFGLENIPKIESEKLAPVHKVVINPELEKALLAEDWKAVADRCEKYDPNDLASSPILRAIMGHSYLVMNRNDESLVMFLSINNQTAQVEWKQWAIDFVKANPSNPVALYLEGDALARSGDWKGAIKDYSATLEFKKDFALAMNARGVAYAYQKDYNKAREDLESAITKDPNFADAYASLGALKVIKEAPDTAIADYNQAIAKSNSFALAFNGRACAKIGYSTDPNSVEKAVSDFYKAATCDSVRPLALENIENIAKIVTDRMGDETMKSSEGMTLTTRQMLHMNTGIVSDYAAKMSTADVTRAYDRFNQNANWSEKWGGTFDKINAGFKGFNLNLSKASDSSFMDARGWRANQMIMYNELKNRGVDPLAGGATTQDIEKGYADRGNWPVKTWFGLVQQVQSPEKLIEGKASKE